jgi:5-methylcytosine-specific restriction endonuclease McrA
MDNPWSTSDAIEFAEWVLKNGGGKVQRSILERYKDRFDKLEQFQGCHPDVDRVLELARAIPSLPYIKQLRADISREYARLFLTIGRRDGFGCAICGVPDPNLQVDHVVPVSKGGTNELSNLQLLCPACNMTKSDKLEQ